MHLPPSFNTGKKRRGEKNSSSIPSLDAAYSYARERVLLNVKKFMEYNRDGVAWRVSVVFFFPDGTRFKGPAGGRF